MRQRRELIVVGLFVIVYILSFQLVVIDHPMGGLFYGWNVYHACWKLFVDPVPNDWEWWCFLLAWIANPLMWLSSLVTIAKFPKLAIMLSIAAIIHGQPVLLALDSLPNGPGYYVWISSPLILIAGNIWLIRNRGQS